MAGQQCQEGCQCLLHDSSLFPSRFPERMAELQPLSAAALAVRTEERVRLAAQLSREGLSAREIGRKMHVSPRTVTRYRRRAEEMGIRIWPMW